MSRQELEDERSFLLRSLEDLDREHAAGDLSDEDHAVLRDGYIARTAAVLRALDAPTPSAASAADDVRVDLSGADRSGGGQPASSGTGERSGARRRGRRRPSGRRRLIVVVVVVVVTAGVIWAVAAAVGPRLSGESLTGSVTLTPAEQAARNVSQAETDESKGDAVDAVKLYQSVLRQEPDQEQALAELGWLEYEAGAVGRQATLLSLGEGEEQRAEEVDPGGFAAHLYLGSMLLAQGDAAAAVAQYRQFLADHPPAAKVRAASSFIVKAFIDDHLTPPALPVG